MSLKFPTLSLVVTKISLNFALCLRNHSIRFKVKNYGTQRSPFFMPFYDTT